MWCFQLKPKTFMEKIKLVAGKKYAFETRNKSIRKSLCGFSGNQDFVTRIRVFLLNVLNNKIHR